MSKIVFSDFVMENIEEEGMREFVTNFIGYDHYEQGLDTTDCLCEAYDRMSDNEYEEHIQELQDIVYPRVLPQGI